MSEKHPANDVSLPETEDPVGETITMQTQLKARGWRKLFGAPKSAPGRNRSTASSSDGEGIKGGPAKWSLGVLNDKSTIEVPGRCIRFHHH